MERRVLPLLAPTNLEIVQSPQGLESVSVQALHTISVRDSQNETAYKALASVAGPLRIWREEPT